MELHFSDKPVLAFAPEYLSVFNERGRAFNLRKLGLLFHMLQDCVCISSPSQIIAPVHDDGRLACIFLESCPYLANESALGNDLRKNTSPPQPLVEVDEAAPFYPPGARNLWHWTTESLPKLLALESSGYTGAYIVPQKCKLVDESLAMHGIDQSRILYNDASYYIRRLVLPPRLPGFALAENQPLSAFLRENILSAVGGALPGEKRCYVRRIGTRRIANEQDILPILFSFGFETMIPEELPLVEQYRYMTNVECSIMPHGANSTLTLLQPRASAAIELFSNRYISYNNLHAVRLLRLRYHALVEDLDNACIPNPPQPTDEYFAGALKADITVDPLHLRVLLESIFEK